VANLNREHLRQQFALFCWVHITLLLIVVSSHFIVNNILEGLIWFFVPASLVINNDVMAYVCGKLFGRTSLFKLSPKKTVEGFVGAFILTLIFALGWGTFWMQFNYMICPAKDLGVNAFSNVVCKPNPVFVWREFEFTGPLRNLLQTIVSAPNWNALIVSLAALLRPSRTLPSSSTAWLWPPLPPSSLPSAASSPRASSARSTSRTLATRFPATVV